jgi:hypothetical protein
MTTVSSAPASMDRVAQLAETPVWAGGRMDGSSWAARVLAGAVSTFLGDTLLPLANSPGKGLRRPGRRVR